jgi:7-alpha-hydroxysteroid dehydrogenase
MPLEHLPPDVREHMLINTPMRRYGTPEDVVAAVLYFAAPSSSWVTGRLLEVDGGVNSPLFPSPYPDL